MYGAIIGDLAGSTYEYSQVKKVSPVIIEGDLITSSSFYSDDTILTIAILDAILNNKDYTYYLKQYGNASLNYKPDIEPYFKTPFSPGFIKWLKGSSPGTSKGNGAMMRISPVGYLFNTPDEVKKNSTLATIPSHNNIESIECSKIIALIIFYAKKGLSKAEIIKTLNIKLTYEPFTKFNTTCQETINNCLYALFNSNSFDGSIKKILSYGGDTDTNACIVGSMAEPLYGIDDSLIQQANAKLPVPYVKKLLLGYSKVNK